MFYRCVSISHPLTLGFGFTFSMNILCISHKNLLHDVENDVCETLITVIICDKDDGDDTHDDECHYHHHHF